MYFLGCSVYAVAQPANVRAGQADIDIPGGDYARVVMSPNLCAQWCNNDPKCTAWSFVKANVSGPDPVCWLKNNVGPAVRRAGVVSGVKMSAQSPNIRR